MNNEKKDTNRTIIIDIETYSIENVSMIWCVVCLDIRTQEYKVFTDKKDFNKYLVMMIS